MATNKKTSQCPNKSIPEDGDFIRIGYDYYITYAQLKTAILGAGTSPTSQTCLADSTTNINLGASSIYKGFTIDCFMKRGTYLRKEVLQVLTDESDAYVFSSGYATIPSSDEETLGISYTADLSSGQCRLNIIVDNSSAYNVTFKYLITKFAM